MVYMLHFNEGPEGNKSQSSFKN